jgi:hypothetical protein
MKHARFRKRMALGRAIERLIILDHVIGHFETTWLGAEDDKVSHFLGSTPLGRDQLPRVVFGTNGDTTTRFFPDKLPIGMAPDKRSYVLLYLVVDPATRDFRTFLRRHAELLRALPKWTVRLLVPVGLEECVEDYRRAFREELATPLHAQVADELRGSAHRASLPFGERGHSMETAQLTSQRRTVWPMPLPVETGAWSVMKYQVSTCISPPWSARPESEEGRTRGGTRLDARCSPLEAGVPSGVVKSRRGDSSAHHHADKSVALRTPWRRLPLELTGSQGCRYVRYDTRRCLPRRCCDRPCDWRVSSTSLQSGISALLGHDFSRLRGRLSVRSFHFN